MRNDIGQSVRLADYRAPDFLIPKTKLLFELDATATRVTADLTLLPNRQTEPNPMLILDGDGLKLTSVSINGAALESAQYQATPDQLIINDVPEREFQLQIITEINPSKNKALMGLYRSNGGYCTQCEAEGFRRITYFLDRPDILSAYDVRIEADKKTVPLLLSNGNLGHVGDLENNCHFAEWHDPHPKPSYLFALVGNDLDCLSDSFATQDGRNVALNIYVEHGKVAQAHYAMDALKRSMLWDENVFGLAYDLDVFNIVAVSDFNMGAMENKGLNIFNDKYVLADAETATDADYANIEAIIAHEYFHNWTGNRITCRDWFQLCLKEGLTVYRDHEFSADMRSRPVKRIAEIRTLFAQQYPEDSGPLSHPVRPEAYREINNFYTATVYEKGSEVVRMLRTILGQDKFQAGLALYFKRHDGDAATVEQFIKAFEDSAGVDLTQFFLWYRQAGTPEIAFETSYDAQKQKFELTLEQSLSASPGQSEKTPMHIPVKFGLLAADGSDLVANISDVLHLKEKCQTFSFENIPSEPVVSLFRELSAPIKLTTTRSKSDLKFLAAHDADPVSKWQALNALLMQELIAMTHQALSGAAPQPDENIITLVLHIAQDRSLEPAFRALCLSTPSETEIARDVARNVDVDAIHNARKAFLLALGAAALKTDLITTSQNMMENAKSRPFSPDAESAGKRAFANAVLELECVGQGSPAPAENHFYAASNMTDRLAALMILTQNFSSEAATIKALAHYRAQFDGNPLALDKWFVAIATTPRSDALETIKATMDDPAFDIGNPNRMRSLIGAFASNNPIGFHRKDGKSYQFFVDLIALTDKQNPQLAARLATTLRSWRSLEPKRRDKLRKTLASLASRDNISTDLQDILQRTMS